MKLFKRISWICNEVDQRNMEWSLGWVIPNYDRSLRGTDWLQSCATPRLNITAPRSGIYIVITIEIRSTIGSGRDPRDDRRSEWLIIRIYHDMEWRSTISGHRNQEHVIDDQELWSTIGSDRDPNNDRWSEWWTIRSDRDLVWRSTISGDRDQE